MNGTEPSAYRFNFDGTDYTGEYLGYKTINSERESPTLTDPYLATTMKELVEISQNIVEFFTVLLLFKPELLFIWW